MKKTFQSGRLFEVEGIWPKKTFHDCDPPGNDRNDPGSRAKHPNLFTVESPPKDENFPGTSGLHTLGGISPYQTPSV